VLSFISTSIAILTGYQKPMKYTRTIKSSQVKT